MPPKSSMSQLDAKVEGYKEMLASRRDTTLLKSLRQNQSADERKWYMFLRKKSGDFSAEQVEHLKQTFSMLKSAPPLSSDAATRVNAGNALAPTNTQSKICPSHSSAPPPVEQDNIATS